MSDTLIQILVPGQKYSFQTLAPGVLGNFDDARLLAIMKPELALDFDENVINRHNLVMAEAGLANVYEDWNSYSYALFEVGGARVLIGIPWINSDTLVVTSTKNYRITFNGITETRFNEIQEILRVAGVHISGTSIIY